MRLAFRLAQVLDEQNDNQRGRISRICKHTSLERHQVAALLNNKVQYLSLTALAALSDYLVEQHKVDPRQLPGRLFGREPENFWELLVKREWLELCVGVRRSTPPELERAWVMASDAYLQGRMLYGIHGLGGALDLGEMHPGHQYLEQRLVSAPGPRGEMEPARTEATTVYSEFDTRAGDRALICLGSVKVNPVVEMVVAHAFRAKPFVSEDDVANPTRRRSPVVFKYRTGDPQPPSCCGGSRLARDVSHTDEPGIYYEQADGTWACVPCIEQASDAALVFYTYRPALGRVELVLGGFSGRATRCLAKELRSLAPQLWPPSYDTTPLQVGLFVIRITFSPTNGEPPPPSTGSEPPPVFDTEVIPIAESVLARRLGSERQ